MNKCIPVDTCPHDVATLLKEYFRDLPEPLLCKGLYTTFLETQRKMDLIIVGKNKRFTSFFRYSKSKASAGGHITPSEIAPNSASRYFICST